MELGFTMRYVSAGAVLILALCCLTSCRTLPKAEVEIRDANGHPRVNVPVTFVTGPYIEFNAVDSTNAAVHRGCVLTDTNGVAAVTYKVTARQPGFWSRAMLDANLVPAQPVQSAYRTSNGETIRSTVWVDVP